MYLPEYATTPEFRAEIARLLPNLGDNEAYWKMTGFLMFSPGLEGGILPIPASLIALIEGKEVNGKYRAWDFLQAYQRDIVRLDITHWQIGECRTVTHIHWPAAVETLLKKERRKSAEQRVLFSCGKKWQRGHSAREREKAQAEAIEIMANTGNKHAYALLNLLNHAVPNRFNAIKKYLPEAHAIVDTLPASEDEKKRQHTILNRIEEQAQPFFAPGDRTVRIFGTNVSLTLLQRDVRKCMTQDWISADLRAAQLGIVAKMWDVPAVNEFLASRRSIWTELCDWMGLDVQKDKPLMKNALYALIFGAGRDKMIDALGSSALYKRFRMHYLIRALLLARARQLREIRTRKYADDAFGTRFYVEYIAIPEKLYSYDNSRKILALIAQSYELLLLVPAIQLAVEHKDSKHGFAILTWLHDGFTFVPFDQNDKESWIRRLREAVGQQAKALCIFTELEIE